MFDIDLLLPHNYEVRELGELPGTGRFMFPVFNFPPADPPGNYGLGLTVRHQTGKTWVGFFVGGYTTPPAISRVVSSLNPDCLCVVFEGAGYVVNASEPKLWEEIPLYPVLNVLQLQRHELLLFSDFTGLLAYGKNGVVWKSPRVCWDDLKIVSVTGDTVEGTGSDPTNTATNELRFVVDLKTGHSLLPPPNSFEGKPVW